MPKGLLIILETKEAAVLSFRVVFPISYTYLVTSFQFPIAISISPVLRSLFLLVNDKRPSILLRYYIETFIL